ncbi:hypothetical protein [Candidatus Tisiphia endosymbiont of Parasteatoda lunata]|uniref:hypothetical protein n=1 Tax=Candidatus Tisiphia endosymbiont of Parasteatoda lunata TaxID=3066275 RepID=UPI00313C5B20
MSQHKKNIFVKCKILLKNILSFLDKIFKIYVETTHCKCGVFLPKWDNKRVFPNDNAVFKTLYLAIDYMTKKWVMPIPNWNAAMAHFLIKFEGRI